MKKRITTAALKRTGKNLKWAGYCEMQELLKNHEPIWYITRPEGWACNVYEVYGLVISTGYTRMTGEHMKQAREYEWRAWNIRNTVQDYDEQNRQVEQLLKELCELNGGSDA